MNIVPFPVKEILLELCRDRILLRHEYQNRSAGLGFPDHDADLLELTPQQPVGGSRLEPLIDLRLQPLDALDIVSTIEAVPALRPPGRDQPIGLLPVAQSRGRDPRHLRNSGDRVDPDLRIGFHGAPSIEFNITSRRLRNIS